MTFRDPVRLTLCALAVGSLACGSGPDGTEAVPVSTGPTEGSEESVAEARQCPDPGDGRDAVLGADTPENRRADRALEEGHQAETPTAIEAALASLRADAGEESTHPWTAYAEGWLLERLDRPEEAQKAYERAIAAHAHFDRANLALGGIHNRAGRTDQALASYRRALEANPGMMLAWYNLAQVHYLQQEYEDALFEWGCALAIEPDDFETRTKIVQTLHALDSFAEARTAREDLRTRWRAGQAADGTTEMVIDQFTVGSHRVYVRESLETPDELYYIYTFLVTKDGRVIRTVQLETSPALAMGNADSLMGMTEGRSHSQLGVVFAERPSYEALRPVARELIDDIEADRHRTTISSSTSP